jgi:hypothetical protein
MDSSWTMDNKFLSLYLSRILSGQYIFIYRDTTYKLIYPDIQVKYNAELYAQQEYEKIKYNEWISEDEVLNFLIEIGLWPINGNDQIQKLEKQIEDYKIELFQNFLNPKKIKSLRNMLNSLKKTLSKYISIRHSLDSVTIEGYCTTLKNQYILIRSIYNNDNNLVFIDQQNIDYNLLNSLSIIINNSTIEIETFKSIARSEAWRSYWNANKNNLFEKSAINWTDEQKTLVVLSKMYDNAHEHPECPPDKVIEDDDMFDGWMIMQKRKSEQEKSKNRTEELLKGKNLQNAKEVFLVANSQEEAQNIYDLNNVQSRNIIKERNRMILNSNKEFKESELPDVQRDLQMQNNQQFIQSRKK